jgi:hypothetical protein
MASPIRVDKTPKYPGRTTELADSSSRRSIRGYIRCWSHREAPLQLKPFLCMGLRLPLRCEKYSTDPYLFG